MRYAVVNLKLNDFRIDHKHSDFVRCGLQKNTHDKCIDAYGLTRTGSAGNQQMWHFRDIRDDRLAGNILTDCKCQRCFGLNVLIRLDQIPESNNGAFLVRHLDTYSSFAGNRCFDSNFRRSKIKLDIICQRYDPADLYALLRSEFVSGYCRTAADIIDVNIDAEISEYLLELLGSFNQMLP